VLSVGWTAPARAAWQLVRTAVSEQARVLPTLPTRLIIIDDSLAVLPLQAAPEAIESVVVVQKSALLEAIIALFEALRAQTRFQLALQATRHGWLDEDSP